MSPDHAWTQALGPVCNVEGSSYRNRVSTCLQTSRIVEMYANDEYFEIKF